jgi:hypothetical protein
MDGRGASCRYLMAQQAWALGHTSCKVLKPRLATWKLAPLNHCSARRKKPCAAKAKRAAVKRETLSSLVAHGRKPLCSDVKGLSAKGDSSAPYRRNL